MDATTIVLLMLSSVGAAFVQRVSGFGFGIFIMTILPYLLPTYPEALTLSGLLAIITSVVIVWKMYKFIVWKKLLPILITFLIVSWIAIQFLDKVGDGMLKHILGGMLILASIWFFFFNDRIHIRPTMTMQVSMGTISGAMGGLFGMQGPPAVLYFLSSTDHKEEYMALAQCFFLIGNGMMSIYRAHLGFLTPTVGWAWCFCLPTVFLGTWIGGLVFNRIPIKTLRKIIYAYMGISGLIALLQ